MAYVYQDLAKATNHPIPNSVLFCSPLALTEEAGRIEGESLCCPLNRWREMQPSHDGQLTGDRQDGEKEEPELRSPKAVE